MCDKGDVVVSSAIGRWRRLTQKKGRTLTRILGVRDREPTVAVRQPIQCCVRWKKDASMKELRLTSSQPIGTQNHITMCQIWYLERQGWMKPSPPSGNHYWSRGRNVSNTSHSKNCMRHVMVASKLSWQDRHLHSRINDYPHRKFDVCSHKTNSKHDDRLLTSRMQMDKAGENGHKANKGVLSLPPQCKSPNAKHTPRPKLSPLGFLF